MKDNVGFGKTFLNFGKDNLDTIAFFGSLFMWGLAIYETARCTPKACEDAKKAKEKVQEEHPEMKPEEVKVSKSEYAKIFFMDYYKPLLAGGTATALQIISRRITLKNLADTIAYGKMIKDVYKNKYDEYVSKNVEVNGESKDQKVRDAIAKEDLEKSADKIKSAGEPTDEAHFTLISEEITGQMWWDKVSNVNDAWNETVAQIQSGGACLSDFLENIKKRNPNAKIRTDAQAAMKYKWIPDSPGHVYRIHPYTLPEMLYGKYPIVKIVYDYGSEPEWSSDDYT